MSIKQTIVESVKAMRPRGYLYMERIPHALFRDKPGNSPMQQAFVHVAKRVGQR
jgi:hypothetical protein